MDKYLQFSGRATRSEFWAVQLIAYALFIVIALVAAGLSMAGTGGLFASGAALVIAVILMFWVTASTTARRCRDAGINAWFTLCIFLPYLGLVAWIVFGCLQTDRGENHGNT